MTRSNPDSAAATSSASVSVFAVAGLLNAVGTGFYYPLSMLLFTRLLHTTFTEIGVLIAVTTLVSLPLLPITGVLIDRFGSRPVAVLSLAIRGSTFFLLLAVPSIPLFVVCNVIIALGARVEASALQLLAADCASNSAAVPRWLALSRVVLVAGYGAGALLAGAAYAAGASLLSAGYVNAASFIVAAILYGCLRHVRRTQTLLRKVRRPRRAGTTPDRRYVLLMISAAVTSAVGTLLESTLAPFLLRYSSAPIWLAGALLALNAALQAVLFLPLAHWLRQRRQARIALTGSLLIAIGILAIPLGAHIALPILATATLATGMVLYSAGEMSTVQTFGVLLTLLPPTGSQGWHLSLSQVVNGIVFAAVPVVSGLLIDGNTAGLWAVVIGLPAIVALLMVLPIITTTLNKPIDQLEFF